MAPIQQLIFQTHFQVQNLVHPIQIYAFPRSFQPSLVLGKSLGREIGPGCKKLPNQQGTIAEIEAIFNVLSERVRENNYLRQTQLKYGALEILLRDRQECDIIVYFVGSISKL